MTERNQNTAAEVGQKKEEIPVHISYEIIRLFSEGLYQSPQKAIEELVSNGFDAGAEAVHVLVPEEPEEVGVEPDPLWVIDNGTGMGPEDFHLLWRVANSTKADVDPATVDRPPIGQFGIGKLASYVLAWRLSHISKRDGAFHYTQMNFRRLEGVHQYDSSNSIDISLYEIDEDNAKAMLSDIGKRSKNAWDMLFGDSSASSWTAAGMSDFKSLYERLSSGRLRWVLSTGLPLQSNFSIWLNDQKLSSSKERGETIKEYVVGNPTDKVAKDLDLDIEPNSIKISGIEGSISGSAKIYQKRLTEGKSDQHGRSHGFFVRVRGRVINLEDELFGINALNHAAWARFSMTIDADGLRDHLLSSREGIRESEPIRILRKYLHGVFNNCRNAFDEWYQEHNENLDITTLLANSSSLYVTEPLVSKVRQNIRNQTESFYVGLPQLPEGTDPTEWLSGFAEEIGTEPFQKVSFERRGRYDRAVNYDPYSRKLTLNAEHPFIDKLSAAAKSNTPATLFGSAELLIDTLLQEHGYSGSQIVGFLEDRDRLLRFIAGDQPSTAEEVLGLLNVANRDKDALERATGKAFKVLGFEYERRGGSQGGADGVLYARLGRTENQLADYMIVYDAKQTNAPSVPADRIDFTSIEDFRVAEDADYAFFIADSFQGEYEEESKINSKLGQAAEVGQKVTLLKLCELRKLVQLHYQYGVTLTQLKELFATCRTANEVRNWIENLEQTLSEQEPQVPLKLLLDRLDATKQDEKAPPNIHAVRAVEPQLKQFTPERLRAALSAVQTIVGSRWIEVDQSGEVRLHHNTAQIVAEVGRYIDDMKQR